MQMETPRLNLREAIKWLDVSYVSCFNRKARSKPLHCAAKYAPGTERQTVGDIVPSQALGIKRNSPLS